MSIGERLKLERERIGYSQEKFGLIGGVQKRAQINYEMGARVPDAAYLRGVAQVGTDVQYVVLGVRSTNLMDVTLSDEFVAETVSEFKGKGAASNVQTGVEVLNAEEQLLINYFRDASKEGKRAALGALLGAAGAAGVGGVTQTSHGDGSIQIGHMGTPRKPSSK